MNGYYKPGMGLGLGHLGNTADRVAPPGMGIEQENLVSGWRPGPGYYLWSVLSVAGMGTGAYHGYKRNRGSVGWAIGWGLLGGLFPIITIPVSLAQGFGKPAVSKNRRRRRTSRRRRRTSR
jgi:hypothetical protein